MTAHTVLFDMDGVVVDSETHWVAREEELFADLLGPGVVDVESEVTGLQYEEVYDVLVAEYGLDVERDAFLAAYEDAAAAVYERADLMPGFEELVSDLHGEGVAVGLVSASPHEWIDMVVERFDLADAFDARVSADDVDGPSKPDPGIYELAAARLDAAPEACIAVEDSRHGIEAAQRAGATTVAYETTHNRKTDFERADVVVSGADELADYLYRST